MQLFQITSPFVQFHSGALRLTDEQARVRLGSITPTKEKGVYLIDSPVGFKRGEVIGFDGEMNRMLQLELVEKTDKMLEKLPEKPLDKLPEKPFEKSDKTPEPKKWGAKPV
jgi:hypothetical protein